MQINYGRSRSRLKPAEHGDDVLAKSISEVLLFRLTDMSSNRGTAREFVGQRRDKGHAEPSNRFDDFLELLRIRFVDAEAEFAKDVLFGCRDRFLPDAFLPNARDR